MNYRKHYNQLIEKAKKENRSRVGLVVYENHHIIPRSENGTDDLNNLVFLTPREHFVAHFLLYMENPKLESRARAFWFLCQDIKGRRHIPSSKSFDIAKQAYREFSRNGQYVPCDNCGAPNYRSLWEIKKYKNVFCSSVCVGSYRKDETKPGSKYRKKTGWSQETKSKMREMRLGRKTLHKGLQCVSVPAEEVNKLVQEGWQLGLAVKPKRKWFTNGIIQIHVRDGNQPPEGFYRGKIMKSNTNGKKAISKDGIVKYVADPEHWISLGWTLGNCKYYPGWQHKKAVVESRKK